MDEGCPVASPDAAPAGPFTRPAASPAATFPFSSPARASAGQARLLLQTFVAGVGDDRDAVSVSVRQPGSHHLAAVAVLLWVRREVRGDGHGPAVACFPYPSDTVAESASAAVALCLDVSQLNQGFETVPKPATTAVTCSGSWRASGRAMWRHPLHQARLEDLVR